MNTKQELIQAFEDFEKGKFGEIAGKEERYAATDKAKANQHKSGRWEKELWARRKRGAARDFD